MRAATITGLDTGWLRTQRRTLLRDGDTDQIALPIPSWLLRHERGDVLVDVGLHPDLALGSESLGAMAKIFAVDLEADGTIGPRLVEHGVDPAGPLTVVLTHGHFDHVGGLVELPNARVLVQSDEWRVARSGEGGYDSSLVDLGHDVVELSGPHDVFGDGAVTCLPTPGHTCGHQSVRVITTAGPVIIAGDACYFASTLDDEVLPPFAHDHDEQLRSLRLLQQERATGTTVIPGHDAQVFLSMTAT